MDEQTQKKFDSILAKDIGSLTEPDKLFLQARRSYLTPEQMEKYFPSSTIDDKKVKMLANLAKARAARKLNKA